MKNKKLTQFDILKIVSEKMPHKTEGEIQLMYYVFWETIEEQLKQGYDIDLFRFIQFNQTDTGIDTKLNRTLGEIYPKK